MDYVGPVADLLDPYLDPYRKQTGGTMRAVGTDYVRWWLERHPGRWALVGQDELGLTRYVVANMGYVPGIRQKPGNPVRTYAQNPHPLGESLAEALRRTPTPPDDLPELTRSSFNWTPEELADACRVARQNLFA